MLSLTFTFIFTETLVLIQATFAPKDISFSKGSKFLMYSSISKKEVDFLFEGLQLRAGVHISLNSKYSVNLSLIQSPAEKKLNNFGAQKEQVVPRRMEG